MNSNDLKVTSKDDDKAVFKKVKAEKNLKGGDPNIDIATQGNFLNEQVFLSN